MLPRFVVPGFRLLAVLLCTICLVGTADAQYFGRNKVHYKDFKFKVLKTAHFDIYFYPAERDIVKSVGRMAERWYARHGDALDHELKGRQPLILYGSHPDFEQTNAISGMLSEGTGGVTEALKRRIVLPVGTTLAETDHVIGHELVHAFQYDITQPKNGALPGAMPTAEQMPLWFIEGMAEFLSLGPMDSHTAMWMRDAVQNQKELPDIKKLENPDFFPYRYGQALLAYVSGRWGDDAVGKLLKTARQNGDLPGAIRKVLTVGPDTLAQNWHAAMHAAYDSLAQVKKRPSDYGTELIHADKKASGLNVSPMLSPDGKQLIFLSSRSAFSIDLYLADAFTGKIKRKITHTDVDPHFQSLQFIYSAGTWDPKSERIAFAAVRKGRPLITILNVAQDKIEREIQLDEVGEAFNPTWSPDGRYIAFSALKGGKSDLFVYDLETDTQRQLTDDLYGDIHPAWSPDGRYIAFSTERFSTDLSDLKIGNYHLALIDPKTGEIQRLSDFSTGKNINPQWAPDAQSLYFASDHTGISNLYRLDLNGGTPQPVTDLYAGVSGITSISPALSVATGRLAFSAYEDGTYAIYSMPVPPQTDIAQDSTQAPMALAELPPLKRMDDHLQALLANPNTGLPDTTGFGIEPYHSDLDLVSVGQPYLAAGISRSGTFVGGGVSFLWSDILGNHHLGTTIQSDNNFNNMQAQVAYENSAHHWNWGGVGQQTSYTTGAYQSGVDVQTPDTAFVEEQSTQQQVSRDAMVFAQYPFSTVSRFEVNMGYQRATYSLESQTRVSDFFTGRVISDEKQDLAAPSALNVFTGNMALVYDNSFFGPTSPILGQRYRFEVGPTLGSVNYVQVLGDFRKYFMLRKPYTLALWGMYIGRYGKDAEDSRVSPLFLGYPGLVRGYDMYSLGFADPVYNQLYGSRMVMTSAELRIPLWQVLTLGRGFFYGKLPVEVSWFYDAGVAWDKADGRILPGGNSNWVRSTGASLRLGLGGYAVLEWAYVYPFDRDPHNWRWQFNFLTPGF